MIDNIQIQNFQSHHNTSLVFHGGLNIIIGQSNSGKSAILRALRLVIENKPSGDSFITKGKKESSVDLIVDGQHITRIKGKNNLYIINEQEYKAFGQEVPEDIKQVINFNDINIQKQLDSPFLLSETSGEIAKFFNKVFNLEKIDSSQQQVKSRLSDTKKRMTILEEDLKEDEEKLKSFDWINEAENKIILLSEQEKEISKMSNEISELSEIIYDYEKVYDSYIAIDDFQEMQEKTEEFINTLISFDAIENDILDLKNLIYEIETVKKKVINNKAELQKLEKQLHDIMPEVCPLCHQKIQ